MKSQKLSYPQRIKAIIKRLLSSADGNLSLKKVLAVFIALLLVATWCLVVIFQRHIPEYIFTQLVSLLGQLTTD